MKILIVCILGLLAFSVNGSILPTPASEGASFYFFSASQGAPETGQSHGFLIDYIIRAGDQLEMRLEVYKQGQAPVVKKDYYTLDQLQWDGTNLYIGSNMITPGGASGNVGGFDYSFTFQLDGSEYHFIDPALGWLPEIIPYIADMTSHYGTLVGHMGGVPFNQEFALTTYPLKDTTRGKWKMISFTDTDSPASGDLIVEMATMQARLISGWGPYAGSAYVRYKGTEYKLNCPATNGVTIEQSVNDDGYTVFTGTILHHELSLDLTCVAPTDQFAHLEHEGETDINTTMLGVCSGTIKATSGYVVVLDEDSVSAKHALLEKKL